MQKRGEKRKKKSRKTLTERIRKRIVRGVYFLYIAFLGISIWLVYVSFIEGKEYKKKALNQQVYTSKEISYKRGRITDRKGVVLAQSISVYNLVLEPARLAKKENYKRPTLEMVHKYFDISMEELEMIVSEKPNSYYVVLKKDVSYDEKLAFEEEVSIFNNRDKTGENEVEREEKIIGYWFEEHYKREYPRKTVASDVIGFTNLGNEGSWGIEEYYNEKLNGRNGKRYGYFNADMEIEETELEAKNGYHITTFLDSDAQKKTEDIIADYMKREGADNVGVLIMNPNNGEIYVMASDKQIDLNEPRNLEAFYKKEKLDTMKDEEKIDVLNGIWSNFCISYSYEPGSTFKPFTVAACLEQKVSKESENFLCDGFATVADRKIHCVKRDGHGPISLSESLEFSCNDVMMQISAKLGRKEFSKYQSRFGIGTKTGIDLPGESVGLVYREEQLNPVELATCSFGQGVSTTMIQIAAGISSIINGGTYYRPRIVKEITNDTGLVIEKYNPIIMRKTVTSKTADFIKKSLYKTVEEGTAKKAKVSGYQVGGKTGTAQKTERVKNIGIVRSEKNYVLSFVGFAPYDKPEALIYVVIDEPKVEEQAKSSAATIMGNEIVKEVFPILGVYSEKVEEKEEK